MLVSECCETTIYLETGACFCTECGQNCETKEVPNSNRRPLRKNEAIKQFVKNEQNDYFGLMMSTASAVTANKISAIVLNEEEKRRLREEGARTAMERILHLMKEHKTKEFGYATLSLEEVEQFLAKPGALLVPCVCQRVVHGIDYANPPGPDGINFI